MRKLLLLPLAILLLYGQLLAQNRTITGKITDENGNPLANVSVLVKGTNIGTVTREDGTYSISVPASATALIFSSVDKEANEVSIDNKETINANLKSTNASLSEVVVVGYQSIAKRNVTGSVSKIPGSDIENKPIFSFDQALTGKAAGVQINTSSGLIGDNVIIRVRGAASISSGSQPLIILDGIPLEQGNQGQLYNPVNALADLNPNDIESIEILKDASAAAIYGSRGAAGVIIITTKKGKAGTTKVDYDMFIGYNEPSNNVDVLNAENYTTVINKMRSNAGLPDAAKYGDIDGDGQIDIVNTNWQDEVYRKGVSQQHNVSMSGGTARSTYFGSINYSDFENYIINNRLRRGSARINATTKVGNWLTLGTNSQFSRTVQDGLGSGTGNAASGIPLGPLLYFPNVPVRDQNGEFYLIQGGNTFGMGVIPNPVAVLLANFDDRENYRYLGSFYGEAQLYKGLKFKTQYNIDYQTSFTDQFWNPDVGDGSGLAGLAQTVNTQNKTWSWFNTLTYNTRINNQHDINVLLGTEYTKSTGQAQYAFGIGLNDPSLTLLTSSNYGTTGADNYFLQNNGLASYFGSINYAYRNKYLATFNFRADASSRFGKDNQTGYFPSGSIAWRASEEEFLRDNKVINDLKIRASYGITGNQNIDEFGFAPAYEPTQYADIPAFTLSAPGNTKLRWERQEAFDIGLDMTIFKNVNIIFDYYNRKTRDLILNNPLLATVGFPGNTILENIGKLENKGVELTVNSTNIKTKDFTWTTNFNIAYSKNTVVATNTNGDDLFGGFGIARPGVDIGTYYLIRWGGVDPQTGWATFFDKDGNLKIYNPSEPAASRWTTAKDGQVTTPITADDRVVLEKKSPYPKFFGGLQNTISFKGFDFSVDAQYSIGSYLYNGTRASLSTFTSQRNKSTELLNAWSTSGQQTDIPKLFWGDNQQSQTSTRFLEKGDFLRLRSIVLGYSIPKNVTDRIKVTRIRIYAQVQNAHTFTGYSGIDPEANINGNANIGLGVDNFAPYLPRTMSVGLNVTF